MATYKLLLLAGDGIGPEVMAEVKKLITWMNARGMGRFETEEGLVGGSCYDAHKVAITEETMAKAHAADAVIFGAVGGPKWDSVPYDVRPEAGLLRLRKDLALYANLRPGVTYPPLAAVYPVCFFSGNPKTTPTSATARSAPSTPRSTTPTRSSASPASLSSSRAS